ARFIKRSESHRVRLFRKARDEAQNGWPLRVKMSRLQVYNTLPRHWQLVLGLAWRLGHLEGAGNGLTLKDELQKLKIGSRNPAKAITAFYAMICMKQCQTLDADLVTQNVDMN
ncbi:hypothetical protein BGX20_004244, partial [Mortierella sp. AD010]